MLLVLLLLGVAPLLVLGADDAVPPSTTPATNPIPMPEPLERRSVTLVYDFEGKEPAPEVVAALKSELEENWRQSRVDFDWRPYLAIRQGDTFPDLVVVHFRGNCQAAPGFSLVANPRQPAMTGGFSDEALAYSPVVDGVVQPFSSVLCDRVHTLVTPDMNGRSTAPPEPAPLYGRALGRVLSHELYHILNQTRQHDRTGLAKSRLSATQLLAPKFDFASVH